MAEPPTCEVKIDGFWQAVSLNKAAVAHSAALKRCLACYGRVMILGTYTGTPSPHPQALT
ncbi:MULTISPECIES: hypothetical protein [Methylobacterium]|uniref:hypothetical protein n=1 Tax=Methylobacterium sp. OT2 TaxID=2813779 RepID=UPI00197B9CD6|nr:MULTISPECIES: hypothetical protein [Methylobacterium]MBN4097885.1 hypothetical protein [Methylobacterium sp. OT2]UIN35135.1 hypothetical protein LXM90_01115 [Methylobacterium oryzae]